MTVHLWGESANGHWKLSLITQKGLKGKNNILKTESEGFYSCDKKKFLLNILLEILEKERERFHSPYLAVHRSGILT